MQESSTINPYFLQQLVTLSSVEEVSTSEDVYSSTGVKLIAKGAPIDANLYERIVSHKLRKPLESSICVSEPITPQHLSDTASVLLDASPSLRRFLGSDGSDVLVSSLVKRARYSMQAGTLLKLHQSKVARSVHHGILVGLLSMGMQRRMFPGGSVELDTLIVASIFHDIGELYLAPELLRASDIPLSPEEWQQMAAHPVIGHAVLRNMGGIAPGVAELVLTHHERLDGSGYPRRLTRKDLSAEAQILAVAEMISRFVGDLSDPFDHACVALRLIPGEFDTRMVDIVAACRAELHQAHLLHANIERADAEQAGGVAARNTEVFYFDVQELLEVIERGSQAMGACEAACTSHGATRAAQQAYEQASTRFERICSAISRAGFDQLSEGLPCTATEIASMRMESQAVQGEISWRLLELSRQVAVQGAELQGMEQSTLLELAEALSPPVL